MSTRYYFTVLFTAAIGVSWSQYDLTVESSPAVGQGGTVYRFYVNMEDPTDRMSAVYGNNEATLLINTPAGVFNSPYNSSWNASGINPAFLSVFPDMADDTYATIGLEGPASSSGIAGAADPSIVEDSAQPITPFFLTNGATDLVSTTLVGSSWYVLNPAGNGLPDANMRVLIAQVTTTGTISGLFNYQIFPFGYGPSALYVTAVFDGPGTFGGLGAGCSDPNACNYSSDASCDYSCYGCTDETAVNFDPEATDDDGSCIAAEGGCTDPSACNYNSIAAIDDGSCVFDGQDLTIAILTDSWPGEITWVLEDDAGIVLAQGGPYTLAGAEYVESVCVDSGCYEFTINDSYGDGICCYGSSPGSYSLSSNGVVLASGGEFSTIEETQICLFFGCTDATANNFDASATVDDGSCLILGCTIEFACNYNPAATDDDGSCEFICPGCTDVSACNYDSGAIQDDGSCSYPEDDGFCDCEGNQLDAVGICGGSCTEDVDEDGICDDVDDCVGQYDECGICQGPGAIYACGCSDAPEGFCDCDGNVLDECGVCGGNGIPEGECDCNGNVLDECGVCGGAGILEGFCDCDGSILDECGVCGGDGSSLDECGVCGGDNSSCTGCTYEFACNYDPTATILDVSLCEFGTCGGCTQLTACNYNPTVVEDDGSCEWCSCIDEGEGVPSSGYSLVLEEYATHSGGELDGLTSYRMYVATPNTNDVISAIYGDVLTPLYIETTTSFYQHPYGSALGSNINPLLFGFFPDLEFDSWMTLGLDAPPGANEVAPSTVGDADSGWVSNFENGQNVVIQDSIGGAMFVTNDPGTLNIISGEDHRILIGQFTTDGELSGIINFQMFTGGVTIPSDNFSIPFDGAGEHSEQIPIQGCTDELASNYCEFYNVNDGSCIYDYVGCTDSEACNYSPNASVSDEALCVYIQEGECDCEGNVFDECGVCGGDGIPEGQCDCEGNVLDECGVCAGAGIPEGQCDCDGNVLDECGVCGGGGIPQGDCDCDGNVLDECGVCGGEGIAEDTCDCDGNVLDALGVCGGDCLADQNNNGICDLIELQSCVDGPEACGLGTIWDEETQTCIVAYPADTNFDGCVQLNDLLDVLSAYGLCQTAEVPWSCGDPVSYQGYDYATVQIGEQCWFAENLRSENYENGDAILSNLSDSEWQNTTSGAVAVYGEGSSTCSNYSPDGDACDEGWSFNEYGRLYNWYSVVDERGLCPSGWHVPTDEEWTMMTDQLGGSSVAGGHMKTEYGWLGGGSGTNSSGFSGLPGGYRHDEGQFSLAGREGFWWSSSPSGSYAWFRALSYYDGDVPRSNYDQRFGFSVRCVRDAE